MEAVNIVLVPSFAWWVAPPNHPVEVVSMIFAIAACAGFLLVGAFYWLALDQRLERRDGVASRNALMLADRLEAPLLLAMSATVASLGFALYLVGWTASLIAAALLTVLAALEYVNYYLWQLQHFDRLSDFLRLARTGRTRRSHMARDLAIYRRRRR
jgi:hypothetical protein